MGADTLMFPCLSQADTLTSHYKPVNVGSGNGDVSLSRSLSLCLTPPLYPRVGGGDRQRARERDREKEGDREREIEKERKIEKGREGSKEKRERETVTASGSQWEARPPLSPGFADGAGLMWGGGLKVEG